MIVDVWSGHSEPVVVHPSMAALAVANSGERGALHSFEKAYKSFSENRIHTVSWWIFLENKRIFAGVRDFWEWNAPQWRKHPTVSIWTHSNEVSGLSVHIKQSVFPRPTKKPYSKAFCLKYQGTLNKNWFPRSLNECQGPWLSTWITFQKLSHFVWKSNEHTSAVVA